MSRETIKLLLESQHIIRRNQVKFWPFLLIRVSKLNQFLSVIYQTILHNSKEALAK